MCKIRHILKNILIFSQIFLAHIPCQQENIDNIDLVLIGKLPEIIRIWLFFYAALDSTEFRIRNSTLRLDIFHAEMKTFSPCTKKIA